MYSWKDIALKYKDEISNLRSEICDSFFTLDSKCPNSYVKAHSILENSIRMSDENVNFIEEFEYKADKKLIERNGGLFPARNILKLKDFENITGLCKEYYQDKELASKIPEKTALHCSYLYLKAKGLQVLPIKVRNMECHLVKSKDNILSVIDKDTGVESRVKVLVSGMKFLGKTSKMDAQKRNIEVESQHTYLIDQDEIVCDRYFFANFNNKDKTLELYAWVKGKLIRKMLVQPLRDRFIGKRACILQKDGVLSKLSYSVDDIAKRHLH
jgi:hypothetical protein